MTLEPQPAPRNACGLRELPEGTVTLLFTDVEGSTRLLDALGKRYADVLAEHRRLLREAFGAHGGIEVDTQGDAFFVAFSRPHDALDAAARAQRTLAAETWPDGVRLRVRIGIHTGAPARTEEGYVGIDVHRAARVMAAGHGGQVLVSEETARLVEPSDEWSLADLGEHTLKDLAQPVRLFQLGGEGLDSDFPALKTLGARPNNLPVQATPLIGRERELDELRAILAHSRLVTLTGPGGTGKTRLALQLAAELLEDFSSGVFFVPLAAIRDPALLVLTIAQTLNLREQPGQTLADTLADYLREKDLLLVLDNLEQVIECAPAVTSLLEAAPELRVVATSREPLRLSGEREYAVEPLRAAEAAALFLERARAAKPTVSVEESVVAEICRRLDYLPLAIELAAARVKLLPPRALLERLDDRLKLLVGGRRDADERQRTLRAAIEWSYDLLSETERALFRRLGVFAGGWTLEAAEAVCAPDGELDVLEGLGSLVDKSLVRQHEVDGDPRFTMLETIREYAAEALAAAGEAEPIGARHTAWCLALAEQSEPELRGREQRRVVELLQAEHDNLRAALDRSLDRPGSEDGLRLAGSIWFFWYLRGHYDEGRRFIQRALATQPGAAAGLRARSLHGLSALSSEQGRHEEGEAVAREALDLYRQASDPRGTANALTEVATNTALRGDLAEARTLLEESLSLVGDSDPWTAGVALWRLGWIALCERSYGEAATHFAECVALYRELGEEGGTGYALFGVGAALVGTGDAEDARKRFVEALDLARELDFTGLAISCVEGIAAVEALSGNAERVPRLLAAADAERRRVGLPRDRPLDDIEQRARAAAVAALGEDRFQALEREAVDIAFEEAVSEAPGPPPRRADAA